MIRNIILGLICSLFACGCYAQQSDTLSGRKLNTRDSISQTMDSLSSADTLVGKKHDSTKGSVEKVGDSDVTKIAVPYSVGGNITERVMQQLKWINNKSTPIFFVSEERKTQGKEIFFYSLCGFLFLLGLFRLFNQAYFTNIFRVYFNTSLRQGQLSEQLVQAKLPNLIMNTFFVIVAGVFLWQLFSADFKSKADPLTLLEVCIAAVAVVYLFKFVFLKFIGWISGFYQSTDYYIFIIFLLNKIIGMLLIPFVILFEFGKPEWFSIVKILALLTIGALIVTRYFKSYGLIGQKLSLRPLHFLIYITGSEVLPLLLLYKASVYYFIR